MKKFTRWLVLLSLLASVPAHAALTNTDRAELPGRNILADKNPGAENGKTGWSVSTGSFAASTSSPLEGGASFTWDAGASTETFTSAAITIPEGMKGQNGVVSCRLQCASGTCTHTLTAYDGSNNLVTPVTISSSTTGAPRTSVNFIFPTSGTVALRLTASANEPSLKTDSCIIGLASDINLVQVSQATLVASGYFAGTSSCNLTRTNTALGATATQSACPGPTVDTNIGPGTLQTTDVDLLKFTINSLPPGTYEVCMSGTGFIGTSGQEGAVGINDGTTTSGTRGHEWALLGSEWGACGVFTYTATANQSWQPFVNSAANQVTLVNNGSASGEQTYFTVKRFPTTADLALRTELLNWRVDANIVDTGTVSLGTTGVSAYTGIESTNMTLTNNTSSSQNILTAQIPCHTTTAPTGTTCSGVAESAGVSFTLPVAGDIEACVDFTWQGDVGDATHVGSLGVGFEIVETPNNAQTITQEGRGRSSANAQNASVNGREIVATPFHSCGTFSFTSAGQKTLRLFYEQGVTGTVNGSTFYIDADATIGQRDAHWVVKPLNIGVVAPNLINGVTVPQNTAGSTTINNYVSKSGNYTATATDETILFTATATLTLPAAANNLGKKYHVATSGATTNVTIDPNASETVCGSTTIHVYADKDGVDIQSDGTNWQGLNGSCFAIGYTLGGNSTCTTGACSQTVHGFVTDISFNTTGRYNVNFVSGACSERPVCTYNAIRNASTVVNANQGTWTTTQIVVNTYTSTTAAAVNDNIEVLCRCIR